MPKRNLYVSESLDELINSSESAIPLASIFQDAVMKYLLTGLCPTCGQETALKKPEVVPVRVTTSPTSNGRPIKQCHNTEDHKPHNFKRGGVPMRCRGVQ